MVKKKDPFVEVIEARRQQLIQENIKREQTKKRTQVIQKGDSQSSKAVVISRHIHVQEQPLSEILKTVRKKSGLDWILKHSDLVQTWCKTVGEEISSQTRVVSIRNRQLTIEVYNTALLQELSSFYKESIFESISAELPKGTIREIRFVNGTRTVEDRE